MSALSTPGGGGTTTQSKPASGKQKYQKLDINSLYCANRNENSEPSSVKSQLSRKHGMQSLGKVPSARRPPANLPSLKTETGQDPNANSISATTTTVSTPATCTSQTITTSSSSSALAGTGVASAVGGAGGAGGWVSLPPPSSPHFRTEFPSLEAAAQPSHRSQEHSQNQPQLRPQTEGSWTCGGTAGTRPESAGSPGAAPASTPAAQQTPAFRAILPSFLMKGSSGGGLGLGSLGSLRESRPGGGGGQQAGGGGGGSRGAPRAPATPRAVEVLTARPILRDEQISSLDDIRDAGWAQNDDIDYDQKLDFSDGESSAPSKASNKNNNNRANIDHERLDTKIMDGDEDQLWAERRQKQSNEVAAAVARARQRKEEEQRRQMRDATTQHKQDSRERIDRDRDRNDNRDKDRSDRDHRDKDRMDNRDRNDNRDRFDNRDRDRDKERDHNRMDNRDRPEDKGRDNRDRDRNDNRDRERDRFDRERDRGDRDRDRDFRDRDYNRNERNETNPAFSKTFQANIPPRFLKQQQSRAQDGEARGGQRGEGRDAWAFAGKPAPRRGDAPPPPAPGGGGGGYSAPRHATHNNGRRSYSRDYSDREDDFRREKDGSGPQWRSEMQDYDRPGRELDRSNSKDSYKDYDYKDKRETDRKSSESNIDHSNRTAADKLAEVFERKSRVLTEPFGPMEPSVQNQAPERRTTPPSNSAQRESIERDFGKTSWADVTQDEPPNYTILKSSAEKVSPPKEEPPKVVTQKVEAKEESKRPSQHSFGGPSSHHAAPTSDNVNKSQSQIHKSPSGQNFTHNVTTSQVSSYANIPSSQTQPSFSENISISKAQSEPLSKPHIQGESLSSTQVQKQPSADHIPVQNVTKPLFTSQKSEKEFSESESVASKSSTDPSIAAGNKAKEVQSGESLHVGSDTQKRPDDKRNERFSNDQLNRIPGKEPVERKSSGSGSEKKSRGYGGGGGQGGGGGGYSVYVRGWGSRESRGRRSHRSSRSNNRASESDGSTDGAPNAERKDRRRAPRSPRGPKKQDRPEDGNRPADQALLGPEVTENREPFAPRGQPSRRGRGGFQGTSRPPAPAKRVTGYGPPNTKSPFSQANRVKETEDAKDGQPGDDKGKGGNKTRTGSSSGRARDRRPKGVGGPLSGEDENWETTSEHSEGGGAAGRRRSVGGRQSGPNQRGQGRNQHAGNRQNAPRNAQGQGPKKDGTGDNKTGEVTEAMGDLKLSSNKKDDDVVDDGFQEVRNKKNSKDTRGPTKEDNQHAAKQPRSHSNQGGNRNGSTTRNPNEKPNSRGSAPVPGKAGAQYERPRQANLAPRFVKQRQKQQMGLVSGFGPDTGAAPPPPPVNAWDKPISQTLRGNVEEPAEAPEMKSAQSSQRSTPAEAPAEPKPAPPPCALNTDKVGVLDGTTPPVETIIFENTNYKTAPPAEALKPKYQPGVNTTKSQGEEIVPEVDSRPLPFNGEVRPRPRSIQELIGDNGRPVDAEGGLAGLQMQFDTSQKAEDSSDMKLDFAFDSDLGQLTEDKTAKSLGLPRSTHMSTSNTISPLAADLNLKIASVKKVWEMPAVAEGGEDLQFAGFEESNTETGAPPNVCKVKPTQQLQSPPPQHYNHVGYQGGYGGLSVPSPPAVLFNSSQQLLGSSQQLQQQGGLYGAFLDQSRGQFGGFPGTPYGAGSAAPYNYQPPPDMFQSLPSQYRMAAAAGGGAAFGQSGQLGNSPSTVLISSSSNSLMSATVKPSNQQIGAIGSKGGGVGGVGQVGSVNTYQQQYLGYSGPVGEAQYSLPGLLPRPAPPASSYYSPYQPAAAPAPTYPLQFTPPAQSGAFGSQFLSSQLQVAAAVQQMQQYRAPMQQQYAPPPQQRPPPQQLKSPLHEHANGFAPLVDAASPTPKGAKPAKAPHSPPHKYHQPPPQHQHHPHQQHPHQQHQQQMYPLEMSGEAAYFQMMGGGNNGRMGQAGGQNQQGGGRGGMVAPRYPAPIQRPHAPAMPLYRTPPPPRQHHAPPPRHNMYYQHHQRNGAGVGERVVETGESGAAPDEPVEAPVAADAPPPAEVKAE